MASARRGGDRRARAARVDRVGYAELDRRSRKVSAGAAQASACARGDRVATLAWNTQAHVEVWYAIMGMGAVCHTLNPRLICAQLAAMVAQSGARVLVVSADLAPLARQIAEARAVDRTPAAHRRSGGCCDATRRRPIVRARSSR